jgi:heme A synthase
MRGYPGWFYSLLVMTVMILFATGCLLTPTMLDLRLEWEMSWRLGGDQRIAVVALHAALSFLMFALLGALWSVHMRAGWRHRKHWRSGLGMVALMIFLLASAIGIYYFGDEQAATASAVSHLAAGSLAFLLFGYHAVIGYRPVVHRHPHHS